ncbi:MAG: hypothetical protein INQ03_03255 [Candidatus Heimdallarchaeota archaeon]|nr:hypothetical protein [Candidatus Heimdallarchaeota archaeon]
MSSNLADLLNLTQNEEKVYSALLEQPNADPLVLAKNTGLPRTRIYDILTKLENKQLIDKKTNGIHVIPPKQAIELIQEKIRKETESKIDALDELGYQLSEVWRQGAVNVIIPGVEIYTFQDIEAKYLSELKDIDSKVFIAASGNSMGGIDWKKSGETLARAAFVKKELDIRYLYADQSMADRMVHAFKHYIPFKNLNISIKSNSELISSFIILDNKLYIFFMGTDTYETKVLTAMSSQLVKTFEWIYQRLWEEGQ